MGLARLAAIKPPKLQHEDFYLLPENVPVLGLWGAVQTQWRHGMAGPTGLDYQGVRASPAFRGIERKQREEVFEGLCIMERAWLTRRAEIDKAERESRA